MKGISEERQYGRTYRYAISGRKGQRIYSNSAHSWYQAQPAFLLILKASYDMEKIMIFIIGFYIGWMLVDFFK